MKLSAWNVTDKIALLTCYIVYGKIIFDCSSHCNKFYIVKKNHWHGVVVFITACLSGSPQFKFSWVPLILCAQRKWKGGDGKQESGDGKQESGDGKAIFDEMASCGCSS